MCHGKVIPEIKSDIKSSGKGGTHLVGRTKKLGNIKLRIQKINCILQDAEE